MKRTLWLLSALLLTAALALPARALAEEESVVIQVATVSAESGAQVDLPVMLDHCAGVDSVEFDLNYDSTALAFVSMTPGDLFAAQYTIVNATEPGRIRVACASALGLGGAGTLFTIRFRLLSDTGSAVSVTSGTVTRVDAEYEQSDAFVSIENGGITLGTAALPSPAVTPWVPATPVPTPSPTPEVTAAPETTAQASATASLSPSPEQITQLNPNLYYVGGGLLLVLIVLIIVLLSRKNKRG